MAKPEKKKQARELRKQGKSIIAIADELEVSKSSVSTWARDIVLTDEQEQYLLFSNERREAQKKGAEANVIKHRNKRIQYQEEGRIKAQEGDLLHLAGCMLYWAEGNKSRADARFSNSDSDMMLVYLKFLREALEVKETKIKMTLNFYLNNGLMEK